MRKAFALKLAAAAMFCVWSYALLTRAQSSPGSSEEKVYHAGQNGVCLPSCLNTPAPPYTAEAKKAKFSGAVLAEGAVTVDGKVEQLRILKSPRLGLDESVIKTLRKWKCKPGLKDGRPGPTIVPFEFYFHLN